MEQGQPQFPANAREAENQNCPNGKEAVLRLAAKEAQDLINTDTKTSVAIYKAKRMATARKKKKSSTKTVIPAHPRVPLPREIGELCADVYSNGVRLARHQGVDEQTVEQLALEQAVADLKRSETLAQQGFVSPTQNETGRLTVRMRERELEQLMAELIRDIVIDATPETIWPFLVDPGKHIEWDGTVAELDPRPGGERRPDLRIGFFLHIPFPPLELFVQRGHHFGIVEIGRAHV